jgi:RNA polymerase sigma-70 factor (ECF subfamily)
MRRLLKKPPTIRRLSYLSRFLRDRPGDIIPVPRNQYGPNTAITMTRAPHEVTQLLVAWGDGDQSALDQLMPLVYDELHKLAHRYMAQERPEHTLQTSALVNEAYVRLIDQRSVVWQNRAQFFGIAATSMRRILVSYARSRKRVKRGAGAFQISLDETAILSNERASEMVALDEALENLTAVDQRKSQVVELRFFGGLSIDETAEVLKVSPGTVMRDWTLAKAWLRREVSRDAGDGVRSTT